MLRETLGESDVQALEQGLVLDGETKKTFPAKLTQADDSQDWVRQLTEKAATQTVHACQLEIMEEYGRFSNSEPFAEMYAQRRAAASQKVQRLV